MKIDTKNQTVEISAKELLGELNRGFMIGLIVYSNENNTEVSGRSYPFTLKMIGSVLEDTLKLTDMLHENIKYDELESVRAYGFKVNEKLYNSYRELAALETDDEIKIEGIDITDKEFVDECISDLRACISFLNNKFNYYD